MSGQPKHFEREQRYLVFKLVDLQKHLGPSDLFNLQQVGRTVAAGREQDGKAPLQCVVVESDWPEYEPTCKAIEARVTRPCLSHSEESDQQQGLSSMDEQAAAASTADLQAVRHAAANVVQAFKDLGRTKHALTLLQARGRCEVAMLKLNDALLKACGD